MVQVPPPTPFKGWSGSWTPWDSRWPTVLTLTPIVEDERASEWYTCRDRYKLATGGRATPASRCTEKQLPDGTATSPKRNLHLTAVAQRLRLPLSVEGRIRLRNIQRIHGEGVQLAACAVGHGLREGRIFQRYRTYAFRITPPPMMIPSKVATQKSMTCPLLSVQPTRPCWCCAQSWCAPRSTA